MNHLLPRFYRRTLEREDAAAVTRAVAEAVDSSPVAAATKAGDPRKLRGIPVCAMGVGGTSPGTDPYGAMARKVRREAR